MSREDITMAVAKDPAIKLFGRTISVPDAQTSDDAESLVSFHSFTWSTFSPFFSNFYAPGCLALDFLIEEAETGSPPPIWPSLLRV